MGVSIFNVQYQRAIEIAREFRRRGRWVVAGGPYPTLVPEPCRADFDTVFEGEAEETWPEFCRDFAAGTPRATYQQVEKVDIRRSPTPRMDLFGGGRYMYFHIQTTRGCPFTCEFCDIIVTDGRRPRTKTIPQVLAEVEAVRAAGGDYVGFSDANFIGDPRYATALLEALRDWGRRHRFPITFNCELTVNCADMPTMLDLFRSANFDSVFVGIESPRVASLHAASKAVNTRGRGTLVDKIRRIQAHGLLVTAGMIVGFDTDDREIFEEQSRFLQEAGIPFTTCGLLFAIERTPLHARLAAEGRLLDFDPTEIQGHGRADLNFVPKLMSEAELRAGYNWLIRRHYAYDNYRACLARAMQSFEATDDPAVRSAARISPRRLRHGLAIAAHYLRSRGAKRRFFVRALADVARTGFTFRKLVLAMAYLVLHKHFHEFVERVHGDPEAVGPAIAWPDPAAGNAQALPGSVAANVR